MKYLMITKQSLAFSAIGDFQESYPKGMIHDNISSTNIIENSECIFVNKSKKKLFQGIFYNVVKDEGNQIYFKIKIEKELVYNVHYDFKTPGWYILLEEKLQNEKNILIHTQTEQRYSDFFPQFFNEISTTNDFRRFEELTYYLLKIIGINDLIKIDPLNAAGKADGFFRIGKLVVMYDATLNKNYLEFKEAQIKAYSDRLKEGKFQFEHKEFTFEDFKKAVWIITKGETKLLKRKDNIKIMEVNIEKLISIYSSRLHYNWDEQELEENLLNI